MDILQLAQSIEAGDTTFKFDIDALVKEYIEQNPVPPSVESDFLENYAEPLYDLINL